MLQFAIFTGPAGVLMADWSDIARNVEFSTNQHGFKSCTAFVPLPPVAAFFWFDHPGLPWIEVWGDDLAWKGRLEDVRLVSGGIEISALGAWSVFGDVPYTDTPTSPAVTTDIVADILVAARASNPTLLSDSTIDLQLSSMYVNDEDYTDADMRQILTRLAALGSTITDPLRWEVGVGTDERLFFRPRGSAGIAWYADVAGLDVEQSLSVLYNSAYTRYNSGASTTATVDDDASIARYGVIRRKAYSSRTTDTTQAEQERNAILVDSATPPPRASVVVDRIFTGNGAQAPLWQVRSGDTLTIRNLPPEAGDTIDRIRTFIIAETRYACDSNTLDITPESPLPTLDVLVSRALEVPA